MSACRRRDQRAGHRSARRDARDTRRVPRAVRLRDRSRRSTVTGLLGNAPPDGRTRRGARVLSVVPPSLGRASRFLKATALAADADEVTEDSGYRQVRRGIRDASRRTRWRMRRWRIGTRSLPATPAPGCTSGCCSSRDETASGTRRQRFGRRWSTRTRRRAPALPSNWPTCSTSSATTSPAPASATRSRPSTEQGPVWETATVNRAFMLAAEGDRDGASAAFQAVAARRHREAGIDVTDDALRRFAGALTSLALATDRADCSGAWA